MKEFFRKNERILKTFIEGFVSYLAINIATTDFSSTTALKGLIVGAIASAISVVINYLDKNKDNEKEPIYGIISGEVEEIEEEPNE